MGSRRHPVTTNFSLQDYLPSQMTVSGGNLVISTQEMNSRGRSYVSGLVTSDVRQQYGRWEVRANLPTGPGVWPAIWLLSDTATNPWSSQGEIDIMENRGTQPNLTSSAFHYGTNAPDPYVLNSIAREQQSVAAGNLVNYHNSFHNYAVEWSSDQVRFYVDDVHHATIHDSGTGGFLSSQTDGMKLILNTAVGGLFLDDPTPGSLLPTTFEIDHVYAYTESGTESVLSFENGSFDANGGSLALSLPTFLVRFVR